MTNNFGFRMLPSYYEAIRPLPDDIRHELWDVIMDYAFESIEPTNLSITASLAFTLLKPTIDKNLSYYSSQSENGKKGGRGNKANGKPNKANGKPNKANGKLDNDSEYDIGYDSGIDNISVTTVYGEFKNVILSDDELSKLKNDYPDYLKKIENLSAYMKSTGKKYKSHYATIKNWARNNTSDIKGKGVAVDGKSDSNACKYKLEY